MHHIIYTSVSSNTDELIIQIFFHVINLGTFKYYRNDNNVDIEEYTYP